MNFEYSTETKTFEAIAFSGDVEDNINKVINNIG